jgi:hypothetical protein
MQRPTAVRANIEHISASVLADYAAGRVFARTSLCELEEHLLLCSGCQRVVIELDGGASRSGMPLDITHVTKGGLIRLWVERSLPGRWLARYTGSQLNGGRGGRLASRSSAHRRINTAGQLYHLVLVKCASAFASLRPRARHAELACDVAIWMASALQIPPKMCHVPQR